VPHADQFRKGSCHGRLDPLDCFLELVMAFEPAPRCSPIPLSTHAVGSFDRFLPPKREPWVPRMVDTGYTLIEAIAQGDHQAFERLVRQHQNALYHFVCRTLGDRSAAEDIIQEVFLRVYRAAPRFDPRARVSTWIFKIAYNLSMNELKRRNRARELATDAAGFTGRCVVDAAAASRSRHELEQELAVALDHLSADQRAALLLRVNQELSYREIGEVLGVSVKSVESLLFRARRRLKQSLGKKQQ
jgi:RNA polymerase sigma-70 factor, ECF subfamily